MLFLKVPKKEAERIRKVIIEKGCYAKQIKPYKDRNFVYFPVKKKCLPNYEYVEREGKSYKRAKGLDEICKELGIKGDTITSFDVIGSIAILKITKAMEPFEKEIAKKLIEYNPQIRTVVKKVKEHHGVFRIQNVKWLAGQKRFETEVKEAGCIFKVKVGKMFFSPRLSFERLRVAKNVRPGWNVAVFFAGVAPFSIIIAKKQPLVSKVLSIELNPEAHKFALENIKLNKVEDKVEVVNADVKEYVQKIKDWADYVVMPLPKTSDLFLEAAFMTVKKGKESGLITLYKFVPKDKPYKDLIETIKNFAKKYGYGVKVEFKRKVRDYSPDTIQVVIDFRFVKEY